jgi:hypothetical protein
MENVRFLAEHGFVFQKIIKDSNSYDSEPYPDTLSEAKEFIVKHKKILGLGTNLIRC